MGVAILFASEERFLRCSRLVAVLLQQLVNIALGGLALLQYQRASFSEVPALQVSHFLYLFNYVVHFF
jgi:hypothetical protein